MKNAVLTTAVKAQVERGLVKNLRLRNLREQGKVKSAECSNV
jgi:hypothetical protein